MEERILSIEQAAEETPWSASTLYRVAPKPDSPFRKVAGRWTVVDADLIEWVRSAPKPRDPISRDPMSGPPRRSGGSFRAQVYELDARRKAA